MKRQVLSAAGWAGMVIVGLVLAGCEGGSSNKELSEADNGSTVSLRTGDEVDISLAGNATTGYQWDTQSYDLRYLQLQEGPVYEADDSNVAGAGGRYRFRFKAMAMGQPVLKLVYHRPFEPGAPAAQTWSVTFVISD